MTSFAIHIHARETRLEEVSFQRKVLLQIRGMAFGATAVPVLKNTGPVERVRVVDGVAGVEMKPTLASLLQRS